MVRGGAGFIVSRPVRCGKFPNPASGTHGYHGLSRMPQPFNYCCTAVFASGVWREGQGPWIVGAGFPCAEIIVVAWPATGIQMMRPKSVLYVTFSRAAQPKNLY